MSSSLFEVIIGLFILSIALLGLNAMEVHAHRLNLNAYYASLAEQQMLSIEERLRMLGAQNSNEQVQIWNQQNQHVLPRGVGVVRGGYPVYDVQLTWSGYSGNNCMANTQERAGCIRETIMV